MPETNLPPILKPHVALNVSHLDDSIQFYTRLFGIDPVKIKPGYAKFDVQNPALNLSLNVTAHQRPSTLSHLGLQVSNTVDVIAIRDRWASLGLQPRDEMQTSCCYAIQDKAWVRDPDGNEWEVFAVLANVEDSNNNTCCQGTTECCSSESPTLVTLEQ